MSELAKLSDFSPGVELKVIHIHPNCAHEHAHDHHAGQGHNHTHDGLAGDAAHNHSQMHHLDHNHDHTHAHDANVQKKPRFSFKLKQTSSDDQPPVGGSAIRRRLMEMGIVPGAVISIERFAPLGDPIEVRIGDCRLSLRKIEASMIEVVAI